MMNTLEFVRECPWDFDEEKLIVSVRADFDGGRDIKPYSKWMAANQYNTIPQEDLIKIQDNINWILSNKINTYETVVDMCDGKTGHFDNSDYFFTHEGYNYWIRLIPVADDYNIYIKAYQA